jgi:AAA ATPase domain
MGVAHIFGWGAGELGLLDREEELSALERAIDAATAGSGAVALVEGQASIGKSHLLSGARKMATRTGLRVLSARGSELELEYPFGVVRQLFEAAVADGRGAGWLSGPADAAWVVSERHLLGQDDGGAVPFATLHALFWLTVNAAAEGTVMLVGDDAHWCDAPSLRFLAYLVRRLEGLPVLVALGPRAWESPLLDEIAADMCLVEVIAAGPRPEFEFGQLLPGEEDPDASDPILDAIELVTTATPIAPARYWRA